MSKPASVGGQLAKREYVRTVQSNEGRGLLETAERRAALAFALFGVVERDADTYADIKDVAIKSEESESRISKQPVGTIPAGRNDPCDRALIGADSDTPQRPFSAPLAGRPFLWSVYVERGFFGGGG